jgi:hypothetical protein
VLCMSSVVTLMCVLWRLMQIPESTEADRGLFKWTWAEYDVYEQTFSASSALTGSLLAGVAEAGVRLSGARNLTCRVEKLQTACVSKDELVNMVTSKSPTWTPDIAKPGLRWPDQPSCNCLPFPFPFGPDRYVSCSRDCNTSKDL